MPHKLGESFWVDKQRGLTPFLVRYLHYQLFNMDIENDSDVQALIDFHAGEKNLSHYLAPTGYFINKSSTIESLVPIYEKMPSFAGLKEGNVQFNNMTKREAALLMLTIMRIAGVQGTHLATMICAGGVSLPKYPGRKTHEIDVTATLDTIDLNDRKVVLDYAMECMRLAAPVSTSHRLATQDFDVDVAGKKYTFPKGTRILIPLSIGMTDTKQWGDDAYELKLGRPGLHEKHMGFNSVGDRSHGRMCPGKQAAQETITDILQVIGKARKPSSAAE